MTRALELRAELNEGLAEAGEKVSVNDLIVRACALALMQHPQAHRSYVDGRHVYHAHANIGIAVALDDGLIVPVVRDADTKSVREIAARRATWSAAPATGKLQPARDRGRHVHRLQPGHVRRGQLLGDHQPARVDHPGGVEHQSSAPVVRDGAVVVRQIMPVTLSCDHRACSGADGARLLQTVKRHAPGPVPAARLSPRGHVHSI